MASSAKAQRYKEWLYGLPHNWIENFVSVGLPRFLSHYGYVLGFSREDRLRIIKSCFFNKTTYYKFCAHNGGDDECDWYRHIISLDDWEKFMNEWKSDEFLDSSDRGFKQRILLQDLIWHCISLENSHQHHRWLKIMYDEEEMEKQIMYDEANAYGGDRRTY